MWTGLQFAVRHVLHWNPASVAGGTRGSGINIKPRSKNGLMGSVGGLGGDCRMV